MGELLRSLAELRKPIETKELQNIQYTAFIGTFCPGKTQ
jgi:hypothetical protein